jgi:hypothetical protein
MNEKCNKYEAYFTFANEETLAKHINECEDCKAEHEKMRKVSAILKEVKPVLRQKRTNVLRMKIACIIFAAIIGGVSFNALDSHYDLVGNLMYGDSVSLEDMGFPVDSYGFLTVDNGF